MTKHHIYGNFKPKDRLQELELIAFAQTTGEDISNTLRMIDKKLSDEYEELMGWNEDE